MTSSDKHPIYVMRGACLEDGEYGLEVDRLYEGALVWVDPGDHRRVANLLVDSGCSIYVRLFKLGNVGSCQCGRLMRLDGVIDCWFGDGGLNVVVNPLVCSLRDVASALRSVGVDCVLLLEEDFEYVSHQCR